MSPWETAPTGAAASIAAALAAALPELETPRLRLRAPRLADFDAYARLCAEERAAGIGGPMDREEAWADFVQMVAGWMLRGFGLWSIERRADGTLLGFLPLNHEWGDPEPELGYLLLPEAEGQGYATEAAESARAFAYATLGLSTLVSYVAAGNHRSERVAARLGARREPRPHPLDAEVAIWRHPAPEALP